MSHQLGECSNQLFLVPVSKAVVVSSVLPSPWDSVDPMPNAGLEVEITVLTVDTASDAQQGFEPIKTADVDDQKEELVEGLDFGVHVEADRPFKRLRMIVEVSLLSLTSSQPVAKEILIHEPADFSPTEATFSRKCKSSVKIEPFAPTIYIPF